MASPSESLSLAVAQTVSFLTKNLNASYAPSTIVKLQTVLEANLTAHYATSWNPQDPVRGSGRRCLTLSPTCLPPRPVWSACATANVQWFDWIAVLGNKEFDLFVDPGCVAIRRDDQTITIWSAESARALAASKIVKPVFSEPMIQALRSAAGSARKTFAQKVLEEDKEEEETIFNMLSDEITQPTWVTPIITQFPIPARSTSPMSSISEQSRCSSRSSNSSSSGFSFTSADTSSSRTSSGKSSSKSEFKPSRRERARQARVFVDTSKNEVTPYDGGKTTVLTGGVMLGGGPKVAIKPKHLAVSTASNAANWRAVRA
ncbi:hypothetical protein CVT26_010541 [Gymnopilus dilepis]|uniref:Anti-proliferative protein domain-containing protein n=1 Tax=Gymnopilus dilepis TaxID=231916 RepID=A0A409VZC4_9AGAR|nr:hypothetical protein CVT26_010541 [Gymnopilus dilepis]